MYPACIRGTLPLHTCAAVSKTLLNRFKKNGILESSGNPLFIVKLFVNFSHARQYFLREIFPDSPACSLWWEPGLTNISTLKRSGRLRRRRTRIQRPFKEYQRWKAIKKTIIYAHLSVWMPRNAVLWAWTAQLHDWSRLRPVVLKQHVALQECLGVLDHILSEWDLFHG